ncbi:hypothetical protein ACJ0PX_24605, partial [Escherichia coli]
WLSGDSGGQSMHNSTYSSIFCFSMSVLLSRRRVSGDLTCR